MYGCDVIKVTVPPALASRIGRDLKVESPATVLEALQAIAHDNPLARAALFDEGERLFPFISVYVNDTLCDHASLEGMMLAANDDLLLVSAISGG